MYRSTQAQLGDSAAITDGSTQGRVYSESGAHCMKNTMLLPVESFDGRRHMCALNHIITRKAHTLMHVEEAFGSGWLLLCLVLAEKRTEAQDDVHPTMYTPTHAAVVTAAQQSALSACLPGHHAFA
jgi:hypothetical protein